MKVINLLKALHKEERTLLKSVKQVADRPQGMSLLNYLFLTIDKHQDYQKEAAFKAAFGRPYIKKEDFKLRHELRIISKACEDLLIHQQMEVHIKRKTGLQDYLLAEVLVDRRATDQAAKELKTMREQYTNYPAHLRLDMEGIIRSLEYALIKLQPRSVKAIEQYQVYLGEWLQYEQLRAARRVSLVQTELVSWKQQWQAFTNITKNEQHLVPDEVIKQIDLTLFNEDLWVQRNLLAKQYQEANLQDGIAFLKAMAKVETRLIPYHPANKLLLRLTYRRIGISYGKLGLMDKATQYFIKAVELADEVNDIQMAEHNNLITQYFFCQQYQKAIDCYKQYESKISKSGYGPGLRTLVASCYLMLNHIPQAKELVFMNSRVSDYKRNTDRQLLAICFYEEGNTEIMERELENALQLLKTNDYYNKEFFLVTCRLLLRFAKAIQLPKDEQRKKLEKIREDLKVALSENRSVGTQSYISLLWMKKELGISNL